MKIKINQKSISEILGIEQKICLSAEEMAKSLKITFFPRYDKKINKAVPAFGEKLKETFIKLGVTIIPYEKAFVQLPFKRFIKIWLLKILSVFVSCWRRVFGGYDKIDRLNSRVIMKIKTGKKIRPGISLVVMGERESGKLAMDYITNLVQSSIITILEMPAHITSDSEFHEHFDTMMKLFAYHMTNIAIIVDDKKWIPYNFNASHPTFYLDGNFEHDVLYTLVPKIAAPLMPPRLSDFIIQKERFNPCDDKHLLFTEDFLGSSSLFEKTNLYPPGKKLDELPFRNEFYKWIGKLHLDNRSGMSYGFLARQLPVKIPQVLPLTEACKKYGSFLKDDAAFFKTSEELFVHVEIDKNKFYVPVPEVWVLTQRSGSDKTRMDPKKDMIKLGLLNGKMAMRLPIGLKLHPDYKPSFDTKVILAHAVSNAIAAAILRFLKPDSLFPEMLEKNGMALAHWHGYINPKAIPKGFFAHGLENPRVPCSSSQSAFYAFEGKFKALEQSLETGQEDFKGDIHIEPDHGTNITFPSLKELAYFLNLNPNVSRLGNLYLDLY